MGAVTDHNGRPVSQPRSSNRTCGFPASGFPTGFTAGSRTGCVKRPPQAIHAQGTVHLLHRKQACALRGHLVPLPSFFAFRYSLIGRSRTDPAFQTCVNHRFFPPSQTHQKQGSFPPPALPGFMGASGPFRRPSGPPPFRRRSRLATPRPLGASPTDARLPFRHAVLTTPVDRAGARWLSTSPPVLPSPILRRGGVHIAAFEACSSFTHVTACRIARPPKVGFVARFRPDRLPEPTARQLSNLTINCSSGSSPHW